MSQNKESLDISNKLYYDILARGMKVTRSISRKTGDGPEEPQREVTKSESHLVPQKRK